MKRKYKYNPETLSYEEAVEKWWVSLLRRFVWMAPSVIIGMVLAILFSEQLQPARSNRLQSKLKSYKQSIEDLNADMDLVEDVLIELENRDKDLYRLALYAEMPKKESYFANVKSTKDLSVTELFEQTKRRMRDIESRLNKQSLSFKELLQLVKDKEKLIAAIPAIQPVRNKDLKQMASGFGYRIDPVYKTRKMHTGMDFTADIGTDIYVTGKGRVEFVGYDGGYGKCVIVNHGFGYKTRYAHMSSFNCRQGQSVNRGDLIGFVGSTGKSTGPHLHYEVERNGIKINPIQFYHSDLTPEQYEKLLQMSEQNYTSFD